MAAITSNSGTFVWSNPSAWSGGKVPCFSFPITGCVSSGGLIQVTITGNPTTGNGVAWANGDTVNIYGVVGTTEANPTAWVIGNLSAGATTTFTLTGSTFTNAYVSGGVAYHGDTVTLASGTLLTLDSSACDSNGQIIVGSDPGTGGTDAIAWAAVTAVTTLTVNTGLALRLRGDLDITGQSGTAPQAVSTMTLGSGSSLIMDPPSGGQYVFLFSYGAHLVCNGTSNGTWPDSLGGNHCVVKTDTTRGGTATYFSILGSVPNSTSTWGGLTGATYTDFSHIGTATQNGILLNISTGVGGGTGGGNISITNCNFNACSWWVLAEIGTSWTGNFTFSNNLFTNSVISNQILATYAIGFTIVTTGTYTIANNSFDLLTVLDHMTTGTMAITGNVFANSIIKANTPSWASDNCFAYNVIVLSAVINFQLGPIRDCYFLRNNTNFSTFQTLANASVTGCVFEQTTGNSVGGICISLNANNVTVKKCFVLPAPGDSKALGSLVAPAATTGLVCEHNLQWGGATYGMIAGGRLGTSVAGGVASCQGNIVYYPSAATNYGLAISEFTDVGNILDFVTLAGHNGFRNPSSGTCKYGGTSGTAVSVVGYSTVCVTNSTAFAAETTGAGNTQIQSGYDFTADPQFTDSARNAAKWNKVVDGGLNDNAGTQTFAAALAALQANPSLTTGTNGLISWVRAGFVPQNASYANTTYSGDALTTDANGNPLNGTVGPMGYPPTSIAFGSISGSHLGGIKCGIFSGGRM